MVKVDITPGKVDFTKDFKTAASNPSVSPAFAAALAHQLFNSWQKQIREKKLTKKDNFIVLECGAGNGDLCANILRAIKSMSADPEWALFYEKIYYAIVEKSPALCDRQKEITTEFSDKVKIYLGDALKLPPLELQEDLKKSGQGIAASISNELVDMFPPHELRLNLKTGGVDVKMVMPYISLTKFRQYFPEISNKLPDLLKKSADLKILYEARYQRLKFPVISLDDLKKSPKDNKEDNKEYQDSYILLSRNDFLELHRYYAQRDSEEVHHSDLASVFQFCEFFHDSQYFPEVRNFLNQHPHFLDKIPPGESRFALIGTVNYLRGLNQLLKLGAEVIIVDYASFDSEPEDVPRTIYRKQYGNDIFRAPGFYDITIDASMSLIAEIAKKLSWQIIFTGRQTQLLPFDREGIHRFPISKAATAEEFHAFFETGQESFGAFRAIVLEKNAAKKFANDYKQSERFFGKPEPVSQFEIYQDTTAKLSVHKKEKKK